MAEYGLKVNGLSIYEQRAEGTAFLVDHAGYLLTNVHSEGPNRPEDLPNARVFMDRSHRTTFSINCTYAGNTLLLKKGNHRFSVDRAVYENRGRQLSEHMFITGIAGPAGGTADKPVGRVYIAVAAGNEVHVCEQTYPGNRDNVRQRARATAFVELRKLLLNIDSK